MTATGLGSSLRDHKETLDKIAGTLIIAMGVFFVLTPVFPKLNREWRPETLIARAGHGRPDHRGARVRDRVDAVRRPDARRDPRRRGDLGRRGERRRPAGLLLARPRGPVPAHGDRVRQGDGRLPLAARPLRDRLAWSPGAILIAMGTLILTGELTQLNIEAQRALEKVGLDFIYNL